MNHSSNNGVAGHDRRQLRKRSLHSNRSPIIASQEQSRRHKLDPTRKFFANILEIRSGKLGDRQPRGIAPAWRVQVTDGDSWGCPFDSAVASELWSASRALCCALARSSTPSNC